MTINLRSLLKQTSALTSGALLAFSTLPALANPEGGNVVSGTATISNPEPTTLQVDQSSDRAIIDWDSFNIAVGETTNFVLPDAEAWTLNRVVGSQDPSQIYGSITSNGNIAIVNPDGLLFGSGSTVDVNRLIASTADIANSDFMAGNLDFGIAGNSSASIVNEGIITAADYGLAALVAPSVRNSGIITARLGQVSLASGNSFTIDPYGDGLIKLAIGDEITGDVYDVATGEAVADMVSNTGTLSADGGTVAMTAATARTAVNSVINNTGVIEARSVGVQGGKIILGGATTATKTADAPVQVVRVSGTLNATGTDEEYPLGEPLEGGHIQITGEAILVSDATINASGRNGGGTVLIGGDYLGGNIDAQDALARGVEIEDEEVPTATFVALDDDVVVRADATEAGDGGKVIVWSDGETVTFASISATGGAESGDGGFIETSGKYLVVGSAADASAANGKAGTWLLDPLDIVIRDQPLGFAYEDNGFTEFDLGFIDTYLENYVEGGPYFGNAYYPTEEGSVVTTDFIESALNSGTSVEISTIVDSGVGEGRITLEDDITKTSGGDAMFSLYAFGDIRVDSGVDIRSTSGKLYVSFVSITDDIIATNLGRFSLNGGGLLLSAADQIRVTSDFDMPNLGIVLDPYDVGSGARSVLVQFDDDKYDFEYDETTVTFDAGSIELVDATASPNTYLNINGRDLTLYDGAIIYDYGSNWRIRGALSTGVDDSDALNGIPEISTIGGSPYWNEHDEPLSGTTPIIEVSTDGGLNITDYFVTAPSGHAILDEYLNPAEPDPVPDGKIEQALLEPEVNQVVQEVDGMEDQPIFGPIQLTPKEQSELFLKQFQADPPELYRSLVAKMGEDVAKGVVAELFQIITEFGLQEVWTTFLQNPSNTLDAILSRADINNMTADIVASAIIEYAVESVISQIFPDSDAPLITDIASNIFSVGVAIDLVLKSSGSTATTAITNSVQSNVIIASAVSLSFKTFKIMRASSLSSYEEDENFAAVSSSLISADNLRLAASELSSQGEQVQADALYQLADDIVEAAAKSTLDVFTGVDGPIIADLLLGMDEVIQLWRSGDEEAANTRLQELYSSSQEKNGGITNDFYEKYFMLLRAPDTKRAYSELYSVLEEIVAGT